MQKLYCFSRKNFNLYMDECKWDDNTLPENAAVISICCTEPVKQNFVHERYDGLNDVHRFNDKTNVLNLDFDDINEEVRVCDGFNAINITKEQADRAVDFIESNKDKDFYIHCNAGKSRSQAFIKYIKEQYPDIDWETNPNNPCLYPNVYVSNMLKRSAREKL